MTKTIEAVSGKEGEEHLYSMRGFGNDADQRFFSFLEYSKNPSGMQNKVHQLDHMLQYRKSLFKIKGLARENKGGTMTNLALDKVANVDLLQMRSGIDQIKKVAIVVTDGLSQKPELTQKSAQQLRNVCHRLKQLIINQLLEFQADLIFIQKGVLIIAVAIHNENTPKKKMDEINEELIGIARYDLG